MADPTNMRPEILMPNGQALTVSDRIHLPFYNMHVDDHGRVIGAHFSSPRPIAGAM